MRRFKISGIAGAELSTRLLVNIADIFVVYAVFAMITVALYQLIHVNIAYMLFEAAAATILTGYIEYRELPLKTQKAVILVSGAVVSVILTLLTVSLYNVFELLMVLVLFLVIWGRAVKNSYKDIQGIFDIRSFYWGIALIGTSDLVLYMLNLMENQKSMISGCTMFYIIISMYLLSTLKTRVLGPAGTDGKKTYLDLVAVVITMLVVLLFSSQSSIRLILLLLSYLHAAVVYVVGLIAIPLGYVAVFILNRIRWAFEAFWHAEITDPSTQAPEEVPFDNAAYQTSIGSFIHVVAYILLIIAVIIAVRQIYKAIGRYMDKERVRDYAESREFIAGFGQLKESLPKWLGALKGKYDAAVDRLLFNIRATTAEKIRHEYKKFIKLLYAKELAAEGNTAGDICCMLGSKYPAVDEYIKAVTVIYEDIRYGTKEPGEEELERFRTYLGKVVNSIEQ